jgi:hypothetical protein
MASAARSLAYLALAALTMTALAAGSLASCSGGGAGGASGATSSTGSAGQSTSGGGSAGVGLVGSGGNTTATCGGPSGDAGDAGDAGDESDGATGCEGLDGGLPWSAIRDLFGGCAGETCHAFPWTPPQLVDQAAYECCDGRLLVAPGDPNASYLVDKLAGIPRCLGHRMPLNGPPYFTDDEMLSVRRWICGGAPAQ